VAVKQTFTSDTTQLEKAMSKLERMNTRLIEQNRKLAAGSQGASRKARSGFGGWIKGLAGVAAGYLSVQTAIRAVIQEIKDKEQLENRSKNFAISVAEAQSDAIGNLGYVSGKAIDDFTARMKKLAKETKVKGGLATIYQSASTGLSSSGADVDLTEQAIRAAAKISPQNPEAIDRLTLAAIHLSKATGTLDAEKNLGFLIGVQSQSAVTEHEKIARNVLPGVMGVAKYGGSANEAGAIVATMTQYMVDVEGRKSATASRNLAEQLAAFLPEKTTYKYEKDRRGRARKVVDVEGTGLTSTMERIKHLQKNAEARTQFLGGASFGSQAMAPVKMLLGEMELGKAKPLEKYLAGIPKPEEYTAYFQQTAANMQRPFEQKIGKSERIVETTGEELMLTPSGRKRAADAIYSVENLDTTLQKAGVGGWARTYRAGQLRYARNIEGKSPQAAYEHAVKGTQIPGQRGGEFESANLKGLDKESKEILLKQLDLLEKMSKTILHGSPKAAQAAIDANLHQHGETGAL